jgi:hypothetical protein
LDLFAFCGGFDNEEICRHRRCQLIDTQGDSPFSVSLIC